MHWRWRVQNGEYANYGNANQWTVNAGLTSLAREATQNTNDARVEDRADLVFTFLRLTGAARADFERAVGWEDLATHLDAMGSAAAGSTMAGQISTGLRSICDGDALVLLRISDYGCRGLTGPELVTDVDSESRYGNFIKLCRLDLFSGKDEAAGGSFGLGKAVYWRFSRIQTAVFSSTVQNGHGVGFGHDHRIFGVQQGVVHRLHGSNYEGRGFFGHSESDEEPVKSTWGDVELARRLHLERVDGRPGTSALLVGFYDPDDDESAGTARDDVDRFAEKLRGAVEENFWPLLTRGRLSVSIEQFENDTLVARTTVDPRLTYTELANALEKFDDGTTDEELNGVGTVVVRDIPITISRRTDAGHEHPSFEHLAKLVVTHSDPQPDSLENRVCLLRRSEMVVETIDKSFEGQKFHAFLLAGAAVSKDSPTDEQRRADDFLRFAEPPAHDQWIPREGRRQASQVNLGHHYARPYKQNLSKIRDAVLKELTAIFGPPPAPADKAPESVMRHLQFLRTRPGEGGVGQPAIRKPSVSVDSAQVADGGWDVVFTVSAPNRPQGWSVSPFLVVTGEDPERLAWDGPLESVDGGRVVDDAVQLDHQPDRRLLKAKVRGRCSTLPIPVSEAVVNVVLRDPRAAVAPRSEAAQ